MFSLGPHNKSQRQKSGWKGYSFSGLSGYEQRHIRIPGLEDPAGPKETGCWCGQIRIMRPLQTGQGPRRRPHPPKAGREAPQHHHWGKHTVIWLACAVGIIRRQPLLRHSNTQHYRETGWLPGLQLCLWFRSHLLAGEWVSYTYSLLFQ